MDKRAENKTTVDMAINNYLRHCYTRHTHALAKVKAAPMGWALHLQIYRMYKYKYANLYALFFFFFLANAREKITIELTCAKVPVYSTNNDDNIRIMFFSISRFFLPDKSNIT